MTASDISPLATYGSFSESNKLRRARKCTPSDSSADADSSPSRRARCTLPKSWKLRGLRHRAHVVLVPPALELLKHLRGDLSLKGFRGCDERMMRYLHDSTTRVTDIER